jgi:uncharacterized protein YndB with AHSA1/START domain
MKEIAMSDRSVTHATFVIDRAYDAPPPRVFAAWATQEAKARWFAGPGEWQAVVREFDFRVGGHERLKGAFPDGRFSDFRSHYFDIVPDRRIVYGYDMYINEAKISVSLATIQFRPAGSGTRLIVTEQGAFLDGYDDAGSREQGTRWLLDKLDQALRQEIAGA